MTEDEAFVRTIVDSPGDDLPRLVYADWLDDRGDPRGAYLRAEAEWAKAKQSTGALAFELNGLAEGLDPVWVARVSRPPVGVCCDHITFLQSEMPVTLSDITEVTSEFGVTLPPQCIAFLLNHNGGEPVGEGLILDTPNGPVADEPSGWWLNPLMRTGGSGWGESSIRGELLVRKQMLSGLPSNPRLSMRQDPLPLNSRWRSWHESYLCIGAAGSSRGRGRDVLVAINGLSRGNVWIPHGDEFDDPNFVVHSPRGLQTLSSLLSEIL